MSPQPVCKKTRHLAAVERAMANFNDLFCYYEFVEEQFTRPRPEEELPTPSMMIPDAFPNSAKARRINIPYEQLDGFSRSMEVTVCGAILMASIEVLLRHIEELGSLPTLPVNQYLKPAERGPEEWLGERLGGRTSLPFDPELLDTTTYWRLRRNAFAHNGNDPLDNSWGERGPALARFWATRVPFPFSKERPSELSAETTLTALRQLRVCAREIDVAVAGRLDLRSVLEELHAEVAERETSLRGDQNRHRRALKVAHLAGIEYDLNCEAGFVGAVLWGSG